MSGTLERVPQKRCQAPLKWVPYIKRMARKLKSDRVLFITTILLVALSVVMVYSASAAVALDRYGRASRFLITQGMWAALGIAMLYVVMRIDYRCYREPVFIWTCLALVSLGLTFGVHESASTSWPPMMWGRRTTTAPFAAFALMNPRLGRCPGPQPQGPPSMTR